MNTYIDATKIVFTEDKRAEVYTNLLNIEHTDLISSTKWLEFVDGIKKNKTGKIILAKVYNKKPARLLQWEIKDGVIVCEIYHAPDNEKWNFKYDYIITIEQIEAFSIIHSYSMNQMKDLRQDFADEALSDTNFLVREG